MGLSRTFRHLGSCTFWACLCTVVFSSPQTRADELADAITGMEGLVTELEAFIETGGFPGSARAQLVAKKTNIEQVLKALGGATVVFGNTGGGSGSTSFDANGNATVTISNSLSAGPTAAVAQALAHEAIHVIDADATNTSIDEELRAFKKEVEVWNTLKKPGDTDKECETNSRLAARGEAALREAIRAAYPNLPEHPPE